MVQGGYVITGTTDHYQEVTYTVSIFIVACDLQITFKCHVDFSQFTV